MTGIIITLLIVIYRFLLTNILGEYGMGYYSIALVIYLFLMTCFAYGIPKALSVILTKQRAEGQYGLLYKTIQSSLIFALLIGGISTVILFVGADLIAVYLMNASYSAYVIRAIAPSILLVCVSAVLRGIFYGTKLTTVSHFSQGIEKGFITIAGIAGAILLKRIAQGNPEIEAVYSALGASIGLTLGTFIACVYLLAYFKNYYKRLLHISLKDTNKDTQKRNGIINTLINTMIPFVLTLIIFHLSDLIDYAVFNHIMGVQGYKETEYIKLLGMLNGKYAFFISIPLLIIHWYASSKIPHLKELVDHGNVRKLKSYTSQILRYTMLFIIPCTALYMLFANPFMDLIFNGNNELPASLLRTGAVSIVFYSLSVILNAVLNTLNDWVSVAKNALFSLIIQVVSLLLMLIIFQWNIIAMIISRIVFAVSLYIFNEHTLRERTGYIQEYKRTITIPVLSSLFMCIISYLLYFVVKLLIDENIAFIIAFIISIPVYILALVFFGGITQREIYRIPFGKFLAPLCRKLHLVK